MAKGPRLSIIIVNYNTGRLLERCLSSVFESAPDADVEVFVVDNASSDDSLERISKFGRRLKLISNQENLGFARGCNKGLKESRGEYVLFLNPDTELMPEALTRMLGFMEANRRVGFAVPKIYLPDGKVQEDSIGPFPCILHVLFYWSSLGSIFPRLKERLFRKYSLTNEAFKVDWGTAACLMGRREILERLGGFDENYFMYCEDVDLCYRAQKMGVETYFYPGAEILHHRGKSHHNQKGIEDIKRRSLYYFFKKNRGLWYALSVMALTVLMASLKLVIVFPLASVARHSQRLQEALELYRFELRWHLKPQSISYVLSC